MSMFHEIPPTAGWPLSPGDFFPVSGRGSLEEDFRSYLGVPYARVTCSGTAAFYLILESLKTMSPRTAVIIPSFVCPLLAIAIIRAGLSVEVCDIMPDSFDYDPDQLRQLCRDRDDVLAVVAVHLAGIPVDVTAVRRIVQPQGIVVIEDCAQSLGAEDASGKVGTQGDAAFFSLCRGKGLTIYEGGVMTTGRVDLAAAFERTFQRLARPEIIAEFFRMLELAGYWIFYRPRVFWFVFKGQQDFWNARGDRVKALGEDFSMAFPVHRVSPFRQAIGHRAFARLEQELQGQRARAARYLAALGNMKAFRVSAGTAGSKPSYPYVTLLFATREKREQAWAALDRLGLGVSLIYARTIGDYDYLRAFVPQREYVNGQGKADRTITLSTSRFLTAGNIELLAACLELA